MTPEQRWIELIKWVDANTCFSGEAVLKKITELEHQRRCTWVGAEAGRCLTPEELRWRKEEPTHRCTTCHHYKIEDQFGKCLITNSSIYALSVTNCAVWQAKIQRVCGTCIHFKNSYCCPDFRPPCKMSEIESCSHWRSADTSFTNKATKSMDIDLVLNMISGLMERVRKLEEDYCE